MSTLYTSRWYRARAIYLRDHPWCVMCLETGHKTQADVVDHIKPHRGDTELFWNEDNWQSLCKACHDRHKQRAERSGKRIGNKADGFPLDKAHHWYK